MVKIIFETILILFPFGQLFKLGIFNLFDGSVLLLAIVTLWRKPVYPNWYKYFFYFLIYLIFGLLINYQNFEIISALYLIRLWSYSMVGVFIFNSKFKADEILDKLLLVSIASSFFGFIQYFLYPNLTSLKYFGWDDHLLRMTGTFLDPAFLGLIIVLEVIIALHKNKTLIAYLLSASLMFTYSRASFLVLLLVLLIDLVKRKSLVKFFILCSSFLIILVLPKNIGEGTNLARTVSINNKLTDYNLSVNIIKNNYIFGVGYNNICNVKQHYLENSYNTNSHSCSGLDSSILLILATTGVIGLILFISFIVQIDKSYLLATSFFVVLVHSLFTNSLFYPHIMFWLFCLTGVTGIKNLKSKINS